MHRYAGSAFIALHIGTSHNLIPSLSFYSIAAFIFLSFYIHDTYMYDIEMHMYAT